MTTSQGRQKWKRQLVPGRKEGRSIRKRATRSLAEKRRYQKNYRRENAEALKLHRELGVSMSDARDLVSMLRAVGSTEIATL